MDEKTQLRTALHNSELKYRKLFDHNIIGIFISDRQGHLFEANEEYLRLTGWTREELERGEARWDTITAAEEVDFCKDNAARAAQSGAVERYEKTYCRRDGTRVPVQVGYSRLNEETDHMVGYAIDLSKQKQFEQELREAVRAREEFLSIASHELKTPMTSLMMQVHLLRHMGRTAGAEHPKFFNKLDSIQHDVIRLSQLVDELLDVTRVKSDQLQIAPSGVELTSLARELIFRFSENTKQGRIRLAAAPERKVWGVWDRIRLDQVISNLISNAIKYGRGRPVEVSIGADRAKATIRVRDEGIGIDPKDQGRIFERFERAVSANYGGLGLGLFIARKIVDRHGGRISVESEVGQGSTFAVELPREFLGCLSDHPIGINDVARPE